MNRKAKTLSACAPALLCALLLNAASAQAKPIKLVPSTAITEDVDDADGVAATPEGSLYVADGGNDRVEEFDASGKFVLTFGKEVDATTKGNLCTAASHDICQHGAEGATAGAFRGPQSIAVDAPDNRVYVQDLFNARIDEYTLTGEFVLTVGREVDATKVAEFKESGNPHHITEAEENVCTVASGDVCQQGVRSPTGSTEQQAFKFAADAADDLAIGPAPEHNLYVGDEQRIQVLSSTGAWQREFPLGSISSSAGSIVRAITVDQSGDVYMSYRFGVNSHQEVITVLDPSGKEVRSFAFSPKHAGNTIIITGMALDAEGALAVAAYERVFVGPIEVVNEPVGILFSAATGVLITKFTLTATSYGLTFSPPNVLHAALSKEVLNYAAVNVAELLAEGLKKCAPSGEAETDVTLSCELAGTVNPYGVPGTEVWFEWGRSPALGERTSTQPIAPVEVPVPVHAELSAVRPNETGFYSRLAAYDENVEPPEEALLSPEVVSATPITNPRVLGAPTAPVSRSSSAVLYAELNPENAQTEAFFEYGSAQALASCPQGVRAEACAGVNASGAQEFACPIVEAVERCGYGKYGTTQEIGGLQSMTEYAYRLFAESVSHTGAEKLVTIGETASFTTSPAPAVRAITDPVTALTPTSAVATGVVDPGGQPAVYAFELGVYAGGETRYGIVTSGETGTAPVEKSVQLTGLLPETTYAYRIKVSSGYGTVVGEPAVFTTPPVPTLAVPQALSMLPMPSVKFPHQEAKKTPLLQKCRRGYARNKQKKCVKTKRRGKRARRR